MKRLLPLLLMVVLLVGCEGEDPNPDFFYDAEGPVLIVEQATEVRQISLFLDQFGRSELRPIEVIPTPEPNDPNDIIRIDPNSELIRSLNLLYDPNFYSQEQSQ